MELRLTFRARNVPYKGFITVAAAGSASAEDQTAAVEEYVKQAAEQIMLGNYYEGGVTLLGTIGQLALGFTGLDAAADLRDVAYDVTHWQWTPGHVAQTLVDVLALLPVAGSLKYLDNVGTLAKNGLRGLEGAGTLVKSGLRGLEGAGTLVKSGLRGLEGAGTLVKSGLPELKLSLGIVSDAGKNLDNLTELAVNGAKHSDAAKQLAKSLSNSTDDLEKAAADTLASARKATKGAGNSQILINKAQGDAFEQVVKQDISQTQNNVVQQITVKTQSGVRTRLDLVGTDKKTGNIILTEAKSSQTAPLTINQRMAFPEIANSGATVIGNGKTPFIGGTLIPPAQVNIVRPK